MVAAVLVAVEAVETLTPMTVPLSAPAFYTFMC